jgi:Xaa-Pro aminopeptidase
MPVRLSAAEFRRRRETIAAKMNQGRIDLLCLFSPAHIFYVTGFAFIAAWKRLAV